MEEQMREQVEEPVVSPVKTCKGCGRTLEIEEKFCPDCGTKYEESISDEVVLTTNQSDAKPPKKKGFKIAIIIVAIVLTVSLVLGGVAILMYNNMKETKTKIVRNLNGDNFGSVVSDYKSLGVIGQSLFRDEIVDAFVDAVKGNPYSSNLEVGVVNVDIIETYNELSEICESLNIEEGHSSNAKEYIDDVLELEEYTKYNEIFLCINAAQTDLQNCYDYIGDASDSVYLRDLYIEWAYDSACAAREIAEQYDTSEYGVQEFIDGLIDMEDTLWDLWLGYSYSASTEGIETTGEMVEEMVDVMEEVQAIVDGLPTVE